MTDRRGNAVSCFLFRALSEGLPPSKLDRPMVWAVSCATVFSQLTRGADTMSELANTPNDEEVLSDEIPDATLEIAGSKWGDGPAAAVTAAFCSGLDSCPSSPRK